MVERRTTGMFVALLLVLGGAACSDDDDDDPAGPRRDAGGGTASDGGPGTGSDGGGTFTSTDLPCEVAELLAAQCTTCHGATPSAGAPMVLVIAADLARPSFSDPTRSMAVVAVDRMRSTTAPMPPAPAAMVELTAIGAFEAWVAASMPAGSCVVNDPFAVPPTCTSGATWNFGDLESPLMRPGHACITCHTAMGEGPRPPLTLAGTVYPTGHEPDDCNGSSAASSGASVEVTDASGQLFRMMPNAAGNFFAQGAVTFPITARVVSSAGVRAMAMPVSSGDCNSCHTGAGAMGAPGRIVLP